MKKILQILILLIYLQNMSIARNHANCSIDCENALDLFEDIPESLCEKNTFHFSNPGLIIWEPGDTLIFVVTTDPDLDLAATGVFIKVLNSYAVSYNAAFMNLNTTYYLFALLGQANAKGGIDFLAGCVQVAGPKPFVFNQIPTPYAGSDTTVCGILAKLNGVPSIIGSSVKWKSLTPNVIIHNDTQVATEVSTNNNYGDFIFEFTEDNNGCIASDDLILKFNSVPFISVYDKICVDTNDAAYPYFAIIKIVEGHPPYSLIQGTGKINGLEVITDTFPSLQNFTIQIIDSNSCQSNLIIDTYNCNCGNISYIPFKNIRKAGLITRLNALTVRSGLWKLVSGPGNVVIEDIKNPSTKVTVDNYGKYCFEWRTTDNDCRVKDTVCVTFFKFKTADPNYPGRMLSDRIKATSLAISNVDSCANALDLFDSQSEYLRITDTLHLHNPGLIIPEPNDTLIFVVSVNPDIDKLASVTFLKILNSYEVYYDSTFLNLNTHYYIYALLGESDYKGGINFLAGCVQITGPKTIVFMKFNCGSINAGRLDSLETVLCTDQCIKIKSTVREFLDAEDTVMYILHQSSYNDTSKERLDTLYSINELICFDTAKGMLPGITYYITRVVGNKIPNKNVIDPQDPCLRASNNQKFSWIPYPKIDAGTDKKQRGLTATLNVLSPYGGQWRMLTGPMSANIVDVYNPNTHVSIGVYGTYCFVWSIDFLGCISEDTVCIKFYKFRTYEPKNPKGFFEDRAQKFNENILSDYFLSPNLIDNSGSSFINVTTNINGNYQWFDIYGRRIIVGKILIDSNQQIIINSPIQLGMYFLLVEFDGILTTQKICVID